MYVVSVTVDPLSHHEEKHLKYKTKTLKRTEMKNYREKWDYKLSQLHGKPLDFIVLKLAAKINITIPKIFRKN